MEFKATPYHHDKGAFTSGAKDAVLEEAGSRATPWYIGICSSGLAILLLTILIARHYIIKYRVDKDILANVVTDLHVLQDNERNEPTE